MTTYYEHYENLGIENPIVRIELVEIDSIMVTEHDDEAQRKAYLLDLQARFNKAIDETCNLPAPDSK